MGSDFQSNGFWLCSRSDLASRTFYFGNVVASVGYMYKVTSGTVAYQATAYWNTCPNGSTLLGTRMEANGYWLCML